MYLGNEQYFGYDSQLSYKDENWPLQYAGFLSNICRILIPFKSYWVLGYRWGNQVEFPAAIVNQYHIRPPISYYGHRRKVQQCQQQSHSKDFNQNRVKGISYTVDCINAKNQDNPIRSVSQKPLSPGRKIPQGDATYPLLWLIVTNSEDVMILLSMNEHSRSPPMILLFGGLHWEGGAIKPNLIDSKEGHVWLVLGLIDLVQQAPSTYSCNSFDGTSLKITILHSEVSPP